MSSSSNSNSSSSSGPLLISQPKLFKNFLASFLRTIRGFFPIEGPGRSSPVLEAIYLDLADRRHIIIYVSNDGQMYAVSYYMPVPHNFPVPALFPGMIAETNFPAILPTKEDVLDVQPPNAVPWFNDMIRVAGVAADVAVPRPRRRASANLLTYWKAMHNFIIDRLHDIKLRHYWTTMPQGAKDILGYVEDSSSHNFVPPVPAPAPVRLNTPRRRRGQTRSDPTRRRSALGHRIHRRTRSANARVVYRRASEMDPHSNHSNADPLDPRHRFPPTVPIDIRGSLDP